MVPPRRHKVLVEKWLTDEEIAEAQKNKQLGWQESDAEGEPKVAAAQVPTPTEVSGRTATISHSLRFIIASCRLFG